MATVIAVQGPVRHQQIRTMPSSLVLGTVELSLGYFLASAVELIDRPACLVRNSMVNDIVTANEAFADMVGLSTQELVTSVAYPDLIYVPAMVPDQDGMRFAEFLSSAETGRYGFDELLLSRFALVNQRTGHGMCDV
jgi:hypothetical protein